MNKFSTNSNFLINVMYSPNENRYDQESFYKRCGDSGILLPRISFGLWHNFGSTDDSEIGRNMIFKAFDLGITHFDVANTYGPPKARLKFCDGKDHGSAERFLGKIIKEDLYSYRREMLIATKAGFDMWPGPYGNWGSRKHLLSSLDESLKRLGLDYVDIFYSHRPDPNTPMEETMRALSDAVKMGKALYIGISNYNQKQTEKAATLLKEYGTPCLIHQLDYSMIVRKPENGLFDILNKHKIGCINYHPLVQGILTNKYLINTEGRMSDKINQEMVNKIQKLNNIAAKRGQSLAQMAISWTLKNPTITSVLIGASKSEQIEENVKSLNNTHFENSELNEIDSILA
jgi:L-glyceraldehyde 3-phosphate reductase